VPVSGSTARLVGALLALSASTFIYVTAETLPIGLLLLIAHDLRSTQSAVGMLVTGYGLVVVLTSVPLTQLTRRVPRRPLLTSLLAVFVAATVVSAAATDYWLLLGARVVCALSQALFWSVVVPTAAGLFPARVRGRALGTVFAGASLAAVLGVPAGTWLGQQSGWRASFVALSGIGLLAMVGVAALLPSGTAGNPAASQASTPDPRRYRLMLIMLVFAVTGSYLVFTYVTPLLTDVAGLSPTAIGPVLLLRGLVGVAGVLIGGPLEDWRPPVATVSPLVLQAVALLGLYLWGDHAPVAIVTVTLSGLAFSMLATSMSTRVLQIAPGSADIAAAGASTVVNVGITAGAFLGGLLLPAFGVRSTALAGALLSLAALAVAFGKPLTSRPPVASPPTGAGVSGSGVAPRTRERTARSR
jgi:DHA1 family inner membrane transport protein